MMIHHLQRWAIIRPALGRRCVFSVYASVSCIIIVTPPPLKVVGRDAAMQTRKAVSAYL